MGKERGGYVRAEKLSAARRTEIARKAARTRWKRAGFLSRRDYGPFDIKAGYCCSGAWIYVDKRGIDIVATPDDKGGSPICRMTLAQLRRAVSKIERLHHSAEG